MSPNLIIVPSKRPRWSRRKQARPEEIASAALDLFSEHGYAATRLEDIAARAGISKGTLYLYFASKEEIFKAVVREGFVSPMAEMRETVQRYEGPTFDLVETLLQRWWTQVGSTRLSAISKLMVAEARNFPELARFYVDEVVQPGRELIVAILERGIDRREFRPLDPRSAAELVIAPLFMLMLWGNSLGCCAPADIDPLPLIEAHVDMLRHGLAAPSPS